jgi:hypothetical protein
MISSFFSEVLTRADWFRICDFVFTHFEAIELMLCVPVALLLHLKTSLLTAQTADQATTFCRSQQSSVRIKEVCRKTLHLLRNTPPK